MCPKPGRQVTGGKHQEGNGGLDQKDACRHRLRRGKRQGLGSSWKTRKGSRVGGLQCFQGRDEVKNLELALALNSPGFGAQDHCSRAEIPGRVLDFAVSQCLTYTWKASASWQDIMTATQKCR